MARKTCFILHFGLNLNFSQSARYLENLIIPKYRHNFSKVRFNCLQFAILDGRYSGISYEKRLCPCNDSKIETLKHVLFECNLSRNKPIKFLNPIMNVFPGWAPICYIKYLLSNTNKITTELVAKFLFSAKRIQNNS